LTKKGVEESTVVSGFGKKTTFCYGINEAKEVVNFSKPSSITGFTFSTVHYTYKMNEINDLVDNEILKSKFSNLCNDFASLGKIEKTKSTLLLTKNG
jgi:hypothetical protein